MAKVNKILGVDIGSYSVKIADITASEDSVTIHQLIEVPLGLEPSASADERRRRGTEIVVDLVKEKKISTKDAAFCLPGQTVFVRKIRLPKTTLERLHRIIEYEARQQIPFPLDQTQREYQIFDLDNEDEVEVILTAVKKEHIGEYYNIIKKSGLRLVNISVSPLALFNFYDLDFTPEATEEEAEKETVEKKKGLGFLKKFLQKKKGAKKGEGEPDEQEAPSEVDALVPPEEDFPVFEEVVAYINIGAKNLDLTIARHGKKTVLGFIRSVPYAGNQITSAIQDKLGLSTFAEAETVKISQTAALTIGFEDEPEASMFDLEASKAATTALERVLGEIRRSLDFYISQPDGVTVDRIVLSGGQVLLPNIAECFEENLGIPVELKKSLDNDKIEIRQEDTEKMPRFLIALGLAFTGANLGKIEINFLPSEQKDILQFKKKNYQLIALSSVLLITILLSAMVGKKYAQDRNTVVEENEDKYRRAKVMLDKTRQAIARRKNIKLKFDKLGKGLFDKRNFWLDFLAKIHKVKPPDVWIDKIQMAPDGKVEIVGKTLQEVSSATFSSNLKDLKGFIKSAEIYRMVKVPEPNRLVHQFTILVDTTRKPSRYSPPPRGAGE